MKPSWLIQTNMDGVDTGPMITEVLAQGMVVHEIKYKLGTRIDFNKYNKNNPPSSGRENVQYNCVICYGDIDFVRQIRTLAPFIPGVWCNFDNMKCSIYYAYFGEHLLNKQYQIMPVGELLRRWDKLTVIPGSYPTIHGLLFIRPDSGAKPFTGYVVKPDGRNKIQTLVETVGPETLIIIAPEKKITAEWRFVICDRQVITGCQYLPIESSGYPTSSLCLAEIIASQEWQPDLCYTVDIAESEGEVYLLEINSFSCVGFYDCNIESIVRWASKMATQEWREYCDPRNWINR